MKIALAQNNYHIGNFEDNRRKIISSINKAKYEGADLVVFSELAITGYPPKDFLEFDDFIQNCINELEIIAMQCQGVAALVGAPSMNPKPEGKNLYNSAYFLNDGEIKKIFNKTLLPTYDVFDEYRYFEPNRKPKILDFKGLKIGVTICEDIWNIGENRMYVQNPVWELKKQGAEVFINLSASPFSYSHIEKRKQVLEYNSKSYAAPFIYVNHVGSQTELIFDGRSMVYNSKGKCIKQLKHFEEDFDVVDLSSFTRPLIPKKTNKIEEIFNALVLGTKDYFGKSGFKKAVVGLSGGIDSAVVFAIAAEALGAENVFGVSMPSEFSSNHSVNDARQLADNLGARFEIVPIKDVYQTFNHTLKPVFGETQFDITEENIQSRCRGVILMAISNKLGYILLNTSNKSELAVGYGTLYGDMCGGLSVIGDVYKTDVFQLAHYINREKEIIPIHTIIKEPSAELRPNQKDSDSLPDYEVLDQILFMYIEERKSPQQIIEFGFSPELVKKILWMVNSSEWKRHQTPPILRVSSKAFGSGRRIPIVGKYLEVKSTSQKLFQ